MSPSVNGNDDMCNDIVITGISGRLPECDTIEEFKQKLLDGVDLVTDDERRWKSGIFGLPVRAGKIKSLDKFDAAFFEVHGKQADKMDPQLRLLLEITYEAIVDAGLNLNEIKGTKTGVFIGTCTNEAYDYWNQDPEGISGYGLLGCTRSMLANRLSYFFDIKGPSYVLDTACSSSFSAFQEAVTAIKTGQCDSAIVGGVNICVNPSSSVHFLKLNMLSPDGKCKVFDESANGYVRAEAVVAVLLQKSKISKRIYATVLGTTTNTDGYKESGITYPSGAMQYQLVRELYNKINIKPEEVAYLECHGTGTKVGDPEETNSMAKIFCENRKNPLLIGAIKSNMGHPEPASGLCAIVKVVIAMETEIIPRNLHFKTPNSNIPGLHDGRLKVVTENEPWKGGIVSINSFGFGGSNAHVVLRSNFKPKVFRPVGPIPILVGVSGRTEESVNNFLQKIEQHKNDDELFALINEIHSTRIKGHNYRGYAIFKDKILKEIIQVPGGTRQIVFIYSGMGSQWAGMAKDLMRVECFNNSIKKCADILKPYQINLEDIIVNGSQDVFNNILHSIIAITAVQIGLTDLIKTLNIEPDFIVGHSLGEIGCAYADGAFTAEETILSSYFRGRAIVDSKLAPGAMASVGLSWEDVKKRCPPNVFPVCNNCQDNVTISGDRESVEKLVAQLKSEGIFCKIVASSGYAFHCNYVKDSGPVLRNALDRIIPNPKRRSSKWISSSVPESKWNTPLAQYNSPDYHVNNLVSPVLFYDALKHLPENVITIEIAPTGLLQAILKRALNPPTTNISLVKRGYPDNVEFFLSAIGKIFTAGGQPSFDKLYKPVSFPVSRGTPMINSMIEWDHSTKWSVPLFSKDVSLSGQLAVDIDINSDSYAFLAGHKIDGRILFPATGYLKLVWSSIAKFRHTDYKQLPIIMENVEFRRATIMPVQGSVKYLVNIFETGSFEVCEGGSVVVSGHFTIPEDTSKEVLNLPVPMISSHEHLPLTKSDIYKELRLRGYEYADVFMGIAESDNYGVVGKLTWNQNWISFIDTMLQFYMIDQNTRELQLPTRIQRIVIDPKNHLQIVEASPTDDTVPVYINRKTGIINSGGIQIRGLTASSAQRRPQVNAAPVLEKYVFIPYENQQPLIEDSRKNRIHILTVISQIVLENKSDAAKLKIAEVGDGRSVDLLISPIIKRIYQSEPKVITEVSIITSAPIDASILQDNEINYAIKDVTAVPLSENAHLVILSDVLKHNRTNILENAVVSIKTGMFLLIEEENGHADISKLCDLEVVSKFDDHKKVYLLLRKPIEIPTDSTVIQINDKNFSWLEPLKDAIKLAEEDTRRIYVVSQGDNYSGIVGMINCLKKERSGSNVRVVFIQDSNASKFSIPAYENQLRKDFVHNVFQNTKWGSFRHLPLEHREENCTIDVEHAYVNAFVKGDLSSLRWIEGPLKYYKNESPDVELCSVYYSALNFRDVMHASGKLPAVALPDKITGVECILGMEFSGRNSVGKRVMGIVGAKSLATTVLGDPGFTWDVPDNWSLEEAATVPVVFVTSYYSLIIRGRLQPGESVLIHAGTGGVGQAAIAIALQMGCTVFSTVSNQVKRDFLKQRFAQLKYENIGNSRDSSFEQMIMMQTNGRGVDVVLNSLASDLLQASVRCLAVGGRFLEIGKVDFVKNSLLGMGIFLKNRTFHGIVLDEIALSNGHDKRILHNLFNDGLINGTVTPLPRTVFNENEVEKAFRYMATGKHIGKVLLKIRDEENLVTTKPVSKKVRSIPRTYMDPTKSYILVGGMGGFGLELANWLITRGAQNIVLNSRSGVKTGYQSLCIRKWAQKGINVLISTTDAATQEGARRLLEESNKLGPVGGIFNLAAVLRDGLLENLTAGDFEISCRPKIICSKYLDVASREMAPNLEYFVNFSSISCGRGNAGQTNYGWANSALERLAESRQGAGLPGKAIQWGAIGEVGLLLEMTGKPEIEIEGTLTQKIASCLSTLDFFLCLPHPVLSSMVIADKHKKVAEEGQVSVMRAIANILGIKDLKNLDLTASLIQIGLDSLMTTEIKQTLERNYDIILSEREIGTLTFGQLAKITKSGGTVKEETTCA